MLEIKNILVPVDFSEHARPAADHAVNLANHFGAELTFLHAVEPIPYTFAPYEATLPTAAAFPSTKEVEEAVTRAMDEFVESLPVDGRATKLVARGNAANVIEEQAREADLVVIPTRGYGAFRRMVLGSVTTKVLNDVSCPVFTGAHVETVAPHDPHPYRRVGVAIHVIEDQTRLLRWADDFAKSYDAKLYVVHAAPLTAITTPAAPPSQQVRDSFVRESRESIARELERLKIDADVYVNAVSSPDRIAPDAVEAKDLNVLVVGRPHGGAMGRLSTHTYDFARRSPCPVISV